MGREDDQLDSALKRVREQVEKNVKSIKRRRARAKWLDSHPWLKSMMFWIDE